MLSYSCFNPKLFVIPNKDHVSPNPLHLYTTHSHVYHIISYTHTQSFHFILSTVEWIGEKREGLENLADFLPGTILNIPCRLITIQTMKTSAGVRVSGLKGHDWLNENRLQTKESHEELLFKKMTFYILKFLFFVYFFII